MTDRTAGEMRTAQEWEAAFLAWCAAWLAAEEWWDRYRIGLENEEKSNGRLI